MPKISIFGEHALEVPRKG